VIGTTPPGGGPGIKGSGLQIHPGLIEVFRCIRGSMRVRVGRKLADLTSGGVIEVPPRTTHGFVDTGSGPLMAEMAFVREAIRRQDGSTPSLTQPHLSPARD